MENNQQPTVAQLVREVSTGTVHTGLAIASLVFAFVLTSSLALVAQGDPSYTEGYPSQYASVPHIAKSAFVLGDTTGIPSGTVYPEVKTPAAVPCRGGLIKTSEFCVFNFTDSRYVTDANGANVPHFVFPATETPTNQNPYITNTINNDWGTGAIRGANNRSDYVSIRWVGNVYLQKGLYAFNTRNDDGMRVSVNGARINLVAQDGSNATAFADNSPRNFKGHAYITTAGLNAVIVEYYERTGQAVAKTSWEYLGDPLAESPNTNNITGVQQFNQNISGPKAYTTTKDMVVGQWMILYGSFPSSGNTVWIGGEQVLPATDVVTAPPATPTAKSGQINVFLSKQFTLSPSTSGFYPVVVKNNGGNGGLTTVGTTEIRYISALPTTTPIFRIDPTTLQVPSVIVGGTRQYEAYFDADGTGTAAAEQKVTLASTWSTENSNVASIVIGSGTNAPVPGFVAGKAVGATGVKASYAYNGITYTAISAINVFPAATPTPTPTPTPLASVCPEVTSAVTVGLNTFTACYFDNKDFTSFKFYRLENIDFNWGLNSPDSRIQPDTFSVRWTGNFNFTDSGDYKFTATTDDGMRVYVDGTLVPLTRADGYADSFRDQGATDYTAVVKIDASKLHNIKVEYFENTGLAVAKLKWDKVSVSTIDERPTINTPDKNATVNGKEVSVTASTGTMVGVNKVSLIIDDKIVGDMLPIGPANFYLKNFDSTQYSNGAHKIEVVASVSNSAGVNVAFAYSGSQVLNINNQATTTPTFRIDPTTLQVPSVIVGGTKQYEAYFDADGAGTTSAEQKVTLASTWSTENNSVASIVIGSGTNALVPGFVFGKSAGLTAVKASYAYNGITYTAISAINVFPASTTSGISSVTLAPYTTSGGQTGYIKGYPVQVSWTATGITNFNAQLFIKSTDGSVTPNQVLRTNITGSSIPNGASLPTSVGTGAKAFIRVCEYAGFQDCNNGTTYKDSAEFTISEVQAAKAITAVITAPYTTSAGTTGYFKGYPVSVSWTSTGLTTYTVELMLKFPDGSVGTAGGFISKTTATSVSLPIPTNIGNGATGFVRVCEWTTGTCTNGYSDVYKDSATFSIYDLTQGGTTSSLKAGEFEAETDPTKVVSPMIVASDSLASGGKYVYTPTRDAGSVTIPFTTNVSAFGSNTHVIWVRVIAPDSASDSFWVSVDGGTSEIFDTNDINNGDGTYSYTARPTWQWVKLNWRGGTQQPAFVPTRAFSLPTGNHTITFAGRDANTRIDKIFVTNNQSAVPQ